MQVLLPEFYENSFLEHSQDFFWKKTSFLRGTIYLNSKVDFTQVQNEATFRFDDKKNFEKQKFCTPCIKQGWAVCMSLLLSIYKYLTVPGT